MSYQLSWINNNVLVVFEGNVDFDEITQANNVVYGDPRFDEMRYQIADFRNINKLNLSKEDAEVLGIMDKSATVWNREIKVACILSDEFTGELFLEYQEAMKDTNWVVEMFNDFEQAETWCKEPLN